VVTRLNCSRTPEKADFGANFHLDDMVCCPSLPWQPLCGCVTLAATISNQFPPPPQEEPQNAMSALKELSSLDLAALVASRVCHDIISPVGAITNGLEVLDEEGSEDMREFAMDLIRKSARQASAKLQFARLAFGAAGSAGAEIDLGDAQVVATGFMENEKSDLNWQLTRHLMPKNYVKLLLNLILIANQCVPRGGEIKVEMEGDPQSPSFTLQASGLNPRIPLGMKETLSGEEPERVDAHSVQPIYTLLLARECGMVLTIDKQEELVKITALLAE
jgi:histidine phosphotransferase ChpT